MPLTASTPKALIPVCGKPLLERSLDFLTEQGISMIGVNAHYQADRLRAFQESAIHPFTLFHEKDAIRGTGGGLYFARDFLGGDEAFFVCNVDIVYSFDLKPILARFLQTDWNAGLLAVPQKGKGTVFYDRKSHAFCGVPADTARTDAMATAAFIGAVLYRRSFLDLLDPDDFSVVPVWKRCIETGRRIGVLEVDCFWRDIGTPAALAAIHFECIDGTISLDVDSRLCIDREACRCFPRTLPGHLLRGIGSYAWVETAGIGENTRISRSVVFAGSTIKAGRIIDNMIVAPDCEVAFG
jgi:MurNAc alpha-1-phosphate uridylyltransferase